MVQGDGTVTYQDPFSAASAVQWFNGKEFKGNTPAQCYKVSLQHHHVSSHHVRIYGVIEPGGSPVPAYSLFTALSSPCVPPSSLRPFQYHCVHNLTGERRAVQGQPSLSV